jgi:hypothetical protein
MFAKTTLLLGLPSATVFSQVTQAQRPSQWDACRAWHIHIADLIDQHRISNDLDEAELYEDIRLLYDAQSACAVEHFGEGLLLYETIPIGRVVYPELR